MSYFPVEYPKMKMANDVHSTHTARVIYSRPHLAGRRLFHDLLKYGEPWRLGANEVTELELYKDVSIQNKKIKAGRYSLYAIPYEDKWTIVFNSNLDTWGLQQDPSKDIARFDVVPTKNNSRLEYYTMLFDSTSTGADLLIAWDDLIVRLPISF